MRIISTRRLRDFWLSHPDSEVSLRVWIHAAKLAEWANFGEIRATYASSVDQFGRCLIFNIGGNKYRLIVGMDYMWQVVYIKAVMMHRDYDMDRWKCLC